MDEDDKYINKQDLKASGSNDISKDSTTEKAVNNKMMIIRRHISSRMRTYLIVKGV